MSSFRCAVSLPITQYRPHAHDHWEVVCQLEGEMQTTVNGETFVMCPGDVMLIPPGAVHSGSSEMPCRDTSLHADTLHFSSFARLRDEQEHIVTLFTMIRQLSTEREGDFAATIHSLIETVNRILNAKLSSNTLTPAVERVKRAVYENISNSDFCLAAEIAKTGFVADYFRRCFQREMGQTPTQYLISLRMERAKQLLRDPKHFTVEAIAHSCGFADALYFSTCFKKHVGISPLGYRKNKGNG